MDFPCQISYQNGYDENNDKTSIIINIDLYVLYMILEKIRKEIFCSLL